MNGLFGWMIAKVEFLLSFLVFFTVARWVWNGVTSELRGEVGFGGIAILLFAALVGVAAGAAFWSFASNLADDRRRRMLLDAVAVALVVLGFVWPLLQSAERPPVAQAPSSAAVTTLEQEEQARDQAWLEQLRQSPHRGPPGQVPPMLQVREVEGAVEVTNTAAKPLAVALARVERDDASRSWRGCPMRPVGEDGGGRYFHSLAPSRTIRYELPADCARGFRNALLEFRVGRRGDELVWWSESAFAAPEGHVPPNEQVSNVVPGQ